MLLRIYAFIFFGLCLWSAVLQYNDPDTTIWMAIYAIPGLAALLYGLNRPYKRALLVLAVLYLAGALYWLPRPWPEKFIDDEVAREFGGLAIIGLSMAMLGGAQLLRGRGK